MTEKTGYCGEKRTKLAILTCLNSNDVCTRSGCLSAFAERKAFFSGYGQNAELAAILTCNGCPSVRKSAPGQDPGVIEKVEALQNAGVEIVHVGMCRLLHTNPKDENGRLNGLTGMPPEVPEGNTDAKGECPRITEICRMLEERGILCVRGTHRE